MFRTLLKVMTFSRIRSHGGKTGKYGTGEPWSNSNKDDRNRGGCFVMNNLSEPEWRKDNLEAELFMDSDFGSARTTQVSL